MATFFKPQAKKNYLDQVFTVDIQRLDINGDGVGKLQNKTMFVSGALPGETVQAKVVEEKSKYLRARALKVKNVSDKRVTPQCKHFSQCGGCDLQHISHAEQVSFKQEKVSELFKRNTNLTDLPWHDPLIGGVWHYRRKARIGVQYNKLSEATVGFRKKGSNVLTPIKNCHLLPEAFSEEFSELTAMINSLSVKKTISHIEVIDAEQPVMIFRHTRPLVKSDIHILQQFSVEKPYQLALQDDQSVYTFDQQGLKQPLPLLSYSLSGYQLEFSESDFVQVNADLNQSMVRLAMDWLDLKSTDHVVDLFCGLGNFSLPIAGKVKSLIGVEGVNAMVKRASDNAEANQVSNTQFFQADLNADFNADFNVELASNESEWSWWHKDINKVLLDPARAGAFNAVKKIAATDINLVLYISCDPATMTRDANVLLEQGFSLQKLCIMDMFAQTKHVETMAVFSR